MNKHIPNSLSMKTMYSGNNFEVHVRCVLIMSIHIFNLVRVPTAQSLLH